MLQPADSELAIRCWASVSNVSVVFDLSKRDGLALHLS